MFKFLTGKAGTGKTWSIRQQISSNPNFGILAASTGIAAINLGDGITTINSLLGYFDTQSLRDSLVSGKLRSKLRRIRNDYDNIIIDEASMLNAEQLDIIAMTIVDINEDSNEDEDVAEFFKKDARELGLILVGDFAQLQPVEGSPAFMAESWSFFNNNIEMLTKIWRQDSIPFVEALEAARYGKGSLLLDKLKTLGVQFYSDIDTNYEGTTIFAKNQQVKDYNNLKMLKLPGRKVFSIKETSGLTLGEWEKIPNTLEVKLGALVMILNNKPIKDDNNKTIGFEYVNGDCGWVRKFEDDVFLVELKRNKKLVEVPRLSRYNESKHKPDMLMEAALASKGYEAWRNTNTNRWVLGEVCYHPIRLAYATTVHKSQGLTLDNVQIDIRNNFFGLDQMLYVALSRARTVEGLRIIAPKEQLLVKRCSADVKVMSFYNRLNSNN